MRKLLLALLMLPMTSHAYVCTTDNVSVLQTEATKGVMLQDNEVIPCKFYKTEVGQHWVCTTQDKTWHHVLKARIPSLQSAQFNNYSEMLVSVDVQFCK